MKLIGNLKKLVDKAEDISAKRSLIEQAGMALTDDEIELVSGGVREEPERPPEQGRIAINVRR